MPPRWARRVPSTSTNLEASRGRERAMAHAASVAYNTARVMMGVLRVAHSSAQTARKDFNLVFRRISPNLRSDSVFHRFTVVFAGLRMNRMYRHFRVDFEVSFCSDVPRSFCVVSGCSIVAQTWRPEVHFYKVVVRQEWEQAISASGSDCYALATSVQRQAVCGSSIHHEALLLKDEKATKKRRRQNTRYSKCTATEQQSPK